MRTQTLTIALVLGASVLAAQTAPRGRETVALPILNFNSDEGVGYGALMEIFDYGNGVRPYRYTVQPTVLLTSRGRKDVTVYFDAPHLLNSSWRLDAYVGREQEPAAPYYGIGNDAILDETLTEGANTYYYRYGRSRTRLMANVQRPVIGSHIRALAGVGYIDAKTNITPFDSGTTLFAQDFPGAPHGTISYGRIGLVMDTRDREIGPHSGWWNEALVQRSNTFTRVTATARRYTPITARLTGASRFLVQQANGEVPIYDLATVQSSYKSDEGLGGSKMLRGIPKNRVMGKGLVLLNNELRWRVTDFRLRRKAAFLMFSGFVDAGRVWAESIDWSEIGDDLWLGYGGGVRLGLGENSVVAVDVGRSSKATQLYLGLGYAY